MPPSTRRRTALPPAWSTITPAQLPPPSETNIHAAILMELARILPPGCVVHHSPNEGKRGRKAQADLRRLGTRAGWPDIEIFRPATTRFNAIQAMCGPLPVSFVNLPDAPMLAHPPCFLEVKRPGERPTPQQVETHAALRACGCFVAVVYSVRDAIVAVGAWLGDDPAGEDIGAAPAEA